MKCDNHPDREAINCSGWAVKRYLCAECRASWTRPSPRYEARCGNRIWEMHGGRSSTDTESTYHNPNAVYERAQNQHTIDRSGEK